MTLKIDMKSALMGVLIGIVLVVSLGAGLRAKEVETYDQQIISHGDEIVFSRINTSTGQIETWKYLVTQIPYYRDTMPMEEPKY